MSNVAKAWGRQEVMPFKAGLRCWSKKSPGLGPMWLVYRWHRLYCCLGVQGMADCPVCGKTSDNKLKPFCSRRCADIDLGRWLKGGYAILGSPADPESPSSSSESTSQED